MNQEAGAPAAASWHNRSMDSIEPGSSPFIPLDATERTPLVMGVYFKSVFGGVPGADELLAAAAASVESRARGTLALPLREVITGGQIHIEVIQKHAMPVPPGEMLEYFNDGAKERAAIDAATHVIVVSTMVQKTPPHAPLWGVLAVAQEAALKTGGVVFDPQQNHCRTMENYDKPFPDNGAITVADHVSVVYSEEDDGTASVLTMGMHALGLPELEMRGVPVNLCTNLGAVVAGLGQKLVNIAGESTVSGDARLIQIPRDIDVELTDLAHASGEEMPGGLAGHGRASVTVTWFDPQEADDEPFLDVKPADRYMKNGGSPAAACSYLLHDLLGQGGAGGAS